MTSQLIIQPEVSGLAWSRFKDRKNAVALDGYVYGKPRYNLNAPSANFNHHEEVDRLSTRATCAQVLVAVRQGLLNLFRTQEGLDLKVYVNDCDQDVCLSWFILNNSWLCENTVNPGLNRLVHIEDMMDTCAGSYPFHKDLPALREITWVFDPYTRFRMSGELYKKEESSYRTVIADVHQRINQHLVGKGGELELDTRFTTIYKSSSWSMIKEIGSNARSILSSEGIKAFVSVTERPDGRWTYSIGRLSPFVDFPVLQLLAQFNLLEEDKSDKWGGSDTIGGSPRYKGSSLNPELLISTINTFTNTLA